MPPQARVWIYISPRKLTQEEMEQIRQEGVEFITTWAAHGNALDACMEIVNDCFILLAADEAQMAASGCSIDASVRFIQQLGKRLGIDFLQRTLVWYRDEQGKMVPSQLNKFWALRKAGVVTDRTRVFNTLVRNVAEFRDQWELPFSDSWHHSMWS